MFRLSIRKEAQKTIARQSRPVRIQMIEELNLLEADPDNPVLDVERIAGGAQLRLRFKGPAAQFRAILIRDDTHRTLDVRTIASRGQVYDPRRLRR